MLGPKGFSIIAFIILSVLVVITKPSFLVNPETGEWKEFGVGSGKTCINITVIIMLIALIAYLLSACIGSTITKWRGKGGGSVGPPNTVHQSTPVPVQQSTTPVTVQQSTPVTAIPVPVQQFTPVTPPPDKIPFPTFGFLF